jgi:DNA mismatch repair protein MutS
MAEKNPKHQKPAASKEGLTPLMQQYHDIKAQYPGTLLFFRLGDFYEMFGEDAQRVNAILEVVLTQRQGIPMCGVPHHAVNAYLKKLIKAGEKVAICEQLEEPGSGKGIVKRGVVRVITPGTILEDNLLESTQNNFLAVLFPADDQRTVGCALADVSTGEFRVTELTRDKLAQELFRVQPGELILPAHWNGGPLAQEIARATGHTVSFVDDWHFGAAEAVALVQKTFSTQSLKPLGLEGRSLATAAAGGLLAYLEKTQCGQRCPLHLPVYYSSDDYLLLDQTALQNLEVVEGLSSRSRADSLLATVDTTITPLGARTLRQWLLRPLLSVAAIHARQEAVTFFVTNGMVRREIREQLRHIADLERILSRVGSAAATPRELAALRGSLEVLPAITSRLIAGKDLIALPDAVARLAERLAVPAALPALIAAAIVDEPPALLKDGNVIRPGFSPELDELRSISSDGKAVISRMEQHERATTGIGSLKIGYTSVFGYYLEVSKSNLGLVPASYIRKQTVANGERFVTPELKAFEDKILSADEKILRLEHRLYRETLGAVLQHAAAIQALAAALAELDIFASFADTAARCQYTCPVVDDSRELAIRDGRHPVIERALASGSFVANDLYLNGSSDRLILLTGPNMAGKSTFLRQAALIVILAQAGSFVPCGSARIGVVDRIFTRIGAGDNLAAGESTFMVEMHETAHILNQFTERSLIILDEVGRGTSTYDGISIAWAAVEYLAAARNGQERGAKILFATHYFELTTLDGSLPGVKNFNVAVREWQSDVVFLHKIVPGAADRSYGIHVAQLAGLPPAVIARANAILGDLEVSARQAPAAAAAHQLDLFAQPSPPPQILIELNNLNPDELTPLAALQCIVAWKDKYGKT